MFTDLLTQWLTGAIERAPEILILAVVAYDLRRQLVECINHNAEILDQLLDRALSRE